MGTAVTLKFCGKSVSDDDLAFIQELLHDFPNLSRTELAGTVAELLNWTRPNGKAKKVECLYFLEDLERAGILKLPERRLGKAKGTKTKVCLDAANQVDQSRLEGRLKDWRPIGLRLVTTKSDRQIWKGLIQKHHYLGFKVPFGAHLRYLMTQGPSQRIIGCLQFSSAAWKVAARDRWIGWNAEQREKGLPAIVQQSRFLICPWVRIKCLASHVLSRSAKQVVADWEKAYGQKPVLLETFVEEGRFKGSCYAAANWLKLGQTQGRGRMDQKHQKNQPIKSVWVAPLCPNARRTLQGLGQE